MTQKQYKVKVSNSNFSILKDDYYDNHDHGIRE